MDLGRDAFTVTYDPGRVDIEAIVLRIRGLGYIPEKAPDATAEPRVVPFDRGAVPEPVRDALARARTTNRLTLINFSAAWCGPCRVLESRVLPDSRVLAALEGFELVKVDTDRHVEPSYYFEVVGLPTLVVLDSTGREIYRHEGMIEADELAQKLTQLVASEEH